MAKNIDDILRDAEGQEELETSVSLINEARNIIFSVNNDMGTEIEALEGVSSDVSSAIDRLEAINETLRSGAIESVLELLRKTPVFGCVDGLKHCRNQLY